MFGLFSKSKKPSGKKKPAAKKQKVQKKSAIEESEPLERGVLADRPARRPRAPVKADGLTEAQSKLDQAKARLADGDFKSGAAPADRKKLIEQALAVHKVQAKLLDDLDEDTKHKLRTLAMEKMFPNKPDE